jgi:hypothetical protein
VAVLLSNSCTKYHFFVTGFFLITTWCYLFVDEISGRLLYRLLWAVVVIEGTSTLVVRAGHSLVHGSYWIMELVYLGQTGNG